MSLPKAPFVDTDQLREEPTRELSADLLSGVLPDWLEQHTYAGSGSVTTVSLSDAGGARLETATSGASEDQVTARSTFQIDPSTVQRIYIEYVGATLENDSECYAAFGIRDVAADNRVLFKLTDIGGSQSRVLQSSTAVSAINYNTTWDSGVAYAGDPLNISLDINFEAGYADVSSEHTTVRHTTIPSEPMYLHAPEVYAHDAAVKTASVSGLRLYVWQ